MTEPKKSSCLAPGSLEGQHIWITGGGSGLGRSMALRFAQLGATLALSGRREEPLKSTADEIQRAGGLASWHPCDVRDSGEVGRALEALVEQNGPLDSLVNNAAGNFLCPAEDLSDNGFNAIVDIVLKGSFHCTRAAGRHWISTQRPGSVLSIVTPYAWTGSAFVMPSAVAKAGVVTMTRSLTAEWARHQIRLNAIAPGPIPTEGAFSRLLPDETLIDNVVKKIPAGRLGAPEELAELAAFLLSPAAAWIYGEVVTLDGGESVRRGGSFNDLVDLPEKSWQQLRERAKR